MFFIKSCTQSFMTRICFYKLFPIHESKTRVLDTYYINKDSANVIKFMKIKSNSTHNRQKTRKSTDRQKITFPKELIENADFFKHVLNKIMTRHE